MTRYCLLVRSSKLRIQKKLLSCGFEMQSDIQLDIMPGHLPKVYDLALRAWYSAINVDASEARASCTMQCSTCLARWSNGRDRRGVSKGAHHTIFLSKPSFSSEPLSLLKKKKKFFFLIGTIKMIELLFILSPFLSPLSLKPNSPFLNFSLLLSRIGHYRPSP